MRVQFITPAAQEFLAAVDFYETQAPGLGNEFILDVADSLILAQEFPPSALPGQLAPGGSTCTGFRIRSCIGLRRKCSA